MAFFPVVAGLYFVFPHRWRWLLLLLASYAFYMSWKPEYALLILASTAVDYFCGIKIEESSRPGQKKLFLYISVVSNLGVLFAFKYLGFFTETFNQLFSASLPVTYWLLPIGISFYTFQTLSYSIDIYRGRIEAERHFGRFALFVSFFPQLVAGPIERASTLLPQLRVKQEFDWPRITSGLRLMMWGMFKKVAIADKLAIIVDRVYGSPEEYGGTMMLMVSVFFAIQIYCDFSGYSDIAIGSARVLGIKLMQNFDTPYFSRSPSEFWRRWHISLSTWFRDYVYIPLGGSQRGRRVWVISTMAVFLISGLWHGANWTFIIWGGLHGLLLLGSQYISPYTNCLYPYLHINWIKPFLEGFLTFTAVVGLWIFFRADTLGDALLFFQNIFDPSSYHIQTFRRWNMLSLGFSHFKSIVVLLCLLFGAEVFMKYMEGEKRLDRMPYWLKPIFYGLAVLFVLSTGVFVRESKFIYFQF